MARKIWGGMMDKNVVEQELARVLSAISNHADGVTLNDIIGTLGPPLSRRTLQRRLQQLKDNKLIFTMGRSRGTHYFVTQTDKETVDLTGEGYIKLTSAGDEIRQKISKPIKERQAVTYHREFLLGYVPNKTF